MKTLVEAARDADEDVAFKMLTQYADGLTTLVELRYRLADLILQEGEGFGPDVTLAIARAFDDYRAGLLPVYVAPQVGPHQIARPSCYSGNCSMDDMCVVEVCSNYRPVHSGVAAAVALVNGMHFGDEVQA